MQDAPPDTETLATIDRLIPPPWAAWKRRVAGLIAVTVLVGLGFVWTGGWLTPNLEVSAAEWGGPGPVTAGIHLTNNGPRSISILSAGTSPGLEQVSVTAADQSLPYILEPGATARVIATFKVSDCSMIDHGDFSWPIEVEFADGAFKMRRTHDWDMRGFVFDERVGSAEDSAWPAAMTQYVCP